jgi:hypothetical protein
MATNARLAATGGPSWRGTVLVVGALLVALRLCVRSLA